MINVKSDRTFLYGNLNPPAISKFVSDNGMANFGAPPFSLSLCLNDGKHLVFYMYSSRTYINNILGKCAIKTKKKTDRI